MRNRITAAALAALLLSASGALAEPVKYTWHGQGINVPGSSKCPGYTLDIHANVENGRISGHWLQVGRVVRNFDFPIAPDGSFGGQVDLQASIMNVKGQVAADRVRFDMKGYCIFGGFLKKVE
ncbi:MAG: hypothetical protein L6R19_01510 [Alphaproteobacteria bacterium]|nr:hypothetical protein [Alphaproteobacteria bacterium]